MSEYENQSQRQTDGSNSGVAPQPSQPSTVIGRTQTAALDRVRAQLDRLTGPVMVPRRAPAGSTRMGRSSQSNGHARRRIVPSYRDDGDDTEDEEDTM